MPIHWPLVYTVYELFGESSHAFIDHTSEDLQREMSLENNILVLTL